MATYERRKGFWRVKVRRAGFPAQTRSFNSKALAQAWRAMWKPSLIAVNWWIEVRRTLTH
jgi:hypothetical protein